jgi:hypothetical protein
LIEEASKDTLRLVPETFAPTEEQPAFKKNTAKKKRYKMQTH